MNVLLFSHFSKFISKSRRVVDEKKTLFFRYFFSRNEFIKQLPNFRIWFNNPIAMKLNLF